MTRSSPPVPSKSPRALLLGALFALLLAAFGVAAALSFARLPFSSLLSSSPRLSWVLLAALLAAFDVFLGGARLHVLASRLRPSFRLRDGVRAHLANCCLAGITPSQSGGGPAQLYVLHRAGLSWTEATALSSINSFASVVALFVFGVALLPVLPADVPQSLRVALGGTLALFGALLAAAVLLLRWTPRSRRRARFLRAPRRAARLFLLRTLRSARLLLARHRAACVSLLPLAFLVFATKLASAFAALRAFVPSGHGADFVAAILLLTIALFFAPTPGAAGVAEFSGAAFLLSRLSPDAAVGFVVLFRLLSTYLPLVVGAVVLVRSPGPILDTPDSRN